MCDPLIPLPAPKDKELTLLCIMFGATCWICHTWNNSNINYFEFGSLTLKVMDNFGAGRPTVLKTVRTLLKEDGWQGFYRGFGPRFLNMSLYGTTMIVTYELISMLAS